jgi:hypothetical protein
MFSSGKAAAASSGANYIEDVFSTYLYTGTGASNTITNGIDLSGKGGLVWIKNRTGAFNNVLTDTVRGVSSQLTSNGTAAASNYGAFSSFNSSGFTVYTADATMNDAYNYASWTFREQAKFFDIVTYTGNGSARTIAHNLGSVPGCIMVKRTDGVSNWSVYHRSIGNTKYLSLNLTNPEEGNLLWNNTTPTSTFFSIGNISDVNTNGATYVAYLFAHNAGGFGLTGTDNVISCGSFTTDSSGKFTVDLGYEPQWVLYKNPNLTQPWTLHDTMRGFNQSSFVILNPSTSAAEESSATPAYFVPTATGFSNPVAGVFSNNNTYIYIAIRRDPMKVPTDATKVFKPIAANSGYDTFQSTGFPIDAQIVGFRAGLSLSQAVVDRLRGVSTVPSNTTYNSPLLSTSATTAETTSNTSTNNWNNTGFSESLSLSMNDVYWNFRRAPGFFDEVCYTGTGSAFTQAHNLGAPPELVIIKNRTTAGSGWSVPNQITSSGYQVGGLNTSGAFGSRTYPGSEFTAQPSATSLFFNTAGSVNSSGANFVAYLFATCAGVSKVGSYTGTGATQTISCGFTGGARFVLVKRTDSTGGWYVWDTARGMVAGTDPSLLLNSTAAEVNANSIYTTTGGFQIVSTAAGINASGGNYIFLAIA